MYICLLLGEGSTSPPKCEDCNPYCMKYASWLPLWVLGWNNDTRSMPDHPVWQKQSPSIIQVHYGTLSRSEKYRCFSEITVASWLTYSTSGVKLYCQQQWALAEHHKKGVASPLQSRKDNWSLVKKKSLRMGMATHDFHVCTGKAYIKHVTLPK